METYKYYLRAKRNYPRDLELELSLLPVLRRKNPVHATLCYFLRSNLILSSHQSLAILSRRLSFSFPHLKPVCIFLSRLCCHTNITYTDRSLKYESKSQACFCWSLVNKSICSASSISSYMTRRNRKELKTGLKITK
jgi:hypothetical protein